jgi:hypothetical protein
MPAATPLVPPPAMKISVGTGSVQDIRRAQTTIAKESIPLLHELRILANKILNVIILSLAKAYN